MHLLKNIELKQCYHKIDILCFDASLQSLCKTNQLLLELAIIFSYDINYPLNNRLINSDVIFYNYNNRKWILYNDIKNFDVDLYKYKYAWHDLVIIKTIFKKKYITFNDPRYV